MIYVDMDGVLVKQTGREQFDRMPWMRDGRELWTIIAKYGPTLISTANRDQEMKTYQEKRAWIDHEIGQEVRLYVMSDDIGKAIYSGPNHVLIDNDSKQRREWEAKGGIFIHHKSAIETIVELRQKGLI